jgi:hypothetical protein
MKHIINYYLRGLGPRQSVAFFEEAIGWMQHIDDSKFVPFRTKFQQAIELYKKSLEPSPQDILTTQITVEEDNCISIWMNIRKGADSLLYNRNGAFYNTGLRLDEILNKAGGDPAGQSAPRKTAIYRRLLKAVRRDIPADELAGANLDKWVSELERANRHIEEMETDKFFGMDNLYITRTNADSRKDVEKAYHDATHFINAMFTYLQDCLCERVIEGINLLIDRAKSGGLDSGAHPDGENAGLLPLKKPEDNGPSIFP